MTTLYTQRTMTRKTSIRVPTYLAITCCYTWCGCNL